MTMFKTKEQIKEIAKPYYLSIEDDRDAVAGYKGYIEGYTQAQQDIKEACSEGFIQWENGKREEYINRDFGKWEMVEPLRASRGAWQAAKISSMKEIQEKDEEIEKLNQVLAKTSQYNKLAQDEITELKRALQLIYDNSRANYIDKQEKEKFRQVVEKYKLHKY